MIGRGARAERELRDDRARCSAMRAARPRVLAAGRCRSSPSPSTATVRPPPSRAPSVGRGVDAAGEAGHDGGPRPRRGRGPGAGEGRPAGVAAREPTIATLRSPSSARAVRARKGRAADRRCGAAARVVRRRPRPTMRTPSGGAPAQLVFGPRRAARRAQAAYARRHRAGRRGRPGGRAPPASAPRAGESSRTRRGAKAGKQGEGEKVGASRSTPPFSFRAAPKGASLYGRPPPVKVRPCGDCPRPATTVSRRADTRKSPTRRRASRRAASGCAPIGTWRQWHPPCFWTARPDKIRARPSGERHAVGISARRAPARPLRAGPPPPPATPGEIGFRHRRRAARAVERGPLPVRARGGARPRERRGPQRPRASPSSSRASSPRRARPSRRP